MVEAGRMFFCSLMMVTRRLFFVSCAASCPQARSTRSERLNLGIGGSWDEFIQVVGKWGEKRGERRMGVSSVERVRSADKVRSSEDAEGRLRRMLLTAKAQRTQRGTYAGKKLPPRRRDAERNHPPRLRASVVSPATKPPSNFCGETAAKPHH